MLRTKRAAGAALRRCAAAAIGVVVMAATANAADAGKGKQDDPLVERGRYLVKIGGCNDCHTPGYAQSGGQVPEAQWLTGDTLGWSGPWGTTYPANLRLVVAGMSEQEWVQRARTAQYRPPMPWFNLRDMGESDLRALYRYIRSLGPAGTPAPAYLPPGDKAEGPVVQFPAPHG